MKISKDHVVEVEYTLTDDEGKVLDTTSGRSPLPYLHGKNTIVPGLEEALEGKSVGDKVTTSISPEKGYGERNNDLVTMVPREEFKDMPDLEAGAQLQGQSEHGTQFFTVLNVTDTEVTLDGNHPLAGITLNFDVEIKSIRPASEEELSHGHVHGPGGHQH
ncbi:MAG: peptidylprolyl isomerase [Bdellovibrionaceae bacterium]|jgi:FKBP-type peptidyl-prolyl cis-trans isomerase SlyD|nr:peptidylprolyl isomerase [Pseudobdellovibrionaceae bacterium]